MPITGTLLADFSNFKTAVDGAQAKLQDLEGSTDKVTAAVTRMTDQSPAKIAQMGASLGDVSVGATGAVGPVNSMREALGSFDGVLNSMGVNIGPAARGLSELGSAAGKTFGELGALTTGGLAVGAAFAGWQIGRAISDVYGLDKSIGDGIANLFGFGDAAEIAGIKTDALALASARAGRAVTDYSEALRINGEFIAAWQMKAEAADLAMSRLHAPEASARQVTEWDAALFQLRESGSMAALTADLASQNFSLTELAKRYSTTVDVLQYYQREQQRATAALTDSSKAFAEAGKQQRAFDDLKEKLAKSAEARTKAASAIEVAAALKMAAAMGELNSAGQGWQGTLDQIDGRVVEAIEYYLRAGVSQGALAQAYGLTATQVRAVASALADETQVHKGANDETDRGAAARLKEAAALQAAAAMVHTLSGEYLTLAEAQKRRDSGGSATIPDLTDAQAEAMGGRAEIEKRVAQGRPENPSTFTPEGLADLAKRQAAFEAMVRYLARVAGGGPVTSIVNTATQGDGGLTATVQTVNIQVSGLLDPRTISQLSEKVAEEIMKNAKLARKFGAA